VVSEGEKGPEGKKRIISILNIGEKVGTRKKGKEGKGGRQET